MNFLNRVKIELRDLVEVVLIPSLCIFFPWNISYFIFKQISKLNFLYEIEVQKAYVEANNRGFISSPREWIQKRRLVTIIDHADHYLYRTRTAKWLSNYVALDGKWHLESTAALYLTFHWGAGMWALESAKINKQNASMLVAGFDKNLIKHRSILYWYIAQRNKSIEKALGNPVIETGRDLRKILLKLRNDEQIIAVADVPTDSAKSGVKIKIGNLNAEIPDALIRYVYDRKIPIKIYVTGIDFLSGRRFLRITDIEENSRFDDVITQIALALEVCIKNESASWHLWSQAERFFKIRYSK